MRKFALVFLLAFAAVFAFAEEEKKNPPVPTCYSIKCYKCYDYAKKHKFVNSNDGSWAERRFECEKAGEHMMIYKCHYGHILYIDTQTGERK